MSKFFSARLSGGGPGGGNRASWNPYQRSSVLFSGNDSAKSAYNVMMSTGLFLFGLGLADRFFGGDNQEFLILGFIHLLPVLWPMVLDSPLPAGPYLLFCVIALVISIIITFNLLQDQNLIDFGGSDDGKKRRLMETVPKLLRGLRGKKDDESNNNNNNSDEVEVDLQTEDIVQIAITAGFTFFSLIQIRNARKLSNAVRGTGAVMAR